MITRSTVDSHGIPPLKTFPHLFQTAFRAACVGRQVVRPQQDEIEFLPALDRIEDGVSVGPHPQRGDLSRTQFLDARVLELQQLSLGERASVSQVAGLCRWRRVAQQLVASQ